MSISSAVNFTNLCVQCCVQHLTVTTRFIFVGNYAIHKECNFFPNTLNWRTPFFMSSGMLKRQSKETRRDVTKNSGTS